MNDDPYTILQLDRNTASLEDVKRAYYYISKIYSPENGGNPAMFARFQNAYRQILLERRDLQRKQETSRIDTSRIQPPRQAFDASNNDRFNQAFRERNSGVEEDGYVYNIDERDYRERSKQQFEQEQARITKQAESVTPMFKQGQFNPSTFHRMFSQLKEQQGGDQKHEGPPKPVSGTQLIPYSDANNPSNTTNLTSLGHSDLRSAYDNNPQNPSEYDQQQLKKLARMKDVTKIEGLSEADARRRMSERNNQSLQYNRDPLNTSVSHFMSDGMGGGSGMGDVNMKQLTPEQESSVQEQMHNRMMELRMQPSQLGGKPSGGMMPYPTNSHTEAKPNSNKEMAGQIRDQCYPVLPTRDNLIPPHQPPHQHMPNLTPQQLQMLQYQQQNMINQQRLLHAAQQRNQPRNDRHEMQEMKDTIKLQQRMINKLLRQGKRKK